MARLRPEDGSLAALQLRADGDGQTCRELMRRMQNIHDTTTEPVIKEMAKNALEMSWLLEGGHYKSP